MAGSTKNPENSKAVCGHSQLRGIEPRSEEERETGTRMPELGGIRFYAPIQPLSGKVHQRIADGLASISGILEAHLPMCHIVATMPKAVRVLVVVFGRWADTDSAISEISRLFRAVFPGEGLEHIWSMNADDPLLDAVRKADCGLVMAKSSRWWRLLRYGACRFRCWTGRQWISRN